MGLPPPWRLHPKVVTPQSDVATICQTSILQTTLSLKILKLKLTIQASMVAMMKGQKASTEVYRDGLLTLLCSILVGLYACAASFHLYGTIFAHLADSLP